MEDDGLAGVVAEGLVGAVSAAVRAYVAEIAFP